MSNKKKSLEDAYTKIFKDAAKRKRMDIIKLVTEKFIMSFNLVIRSFSLEITKNIQKKSKKVKHQFILAF